MAGSGSVVGGVAVIAVTHEGRRRWRRRCGCGSQGR